MNNQQALPFEGASKTLHPPKFNVVIIYETVADGNRAKRFSDRVAAEVDDGYHMASGRSSRSANPSSAPNRMSPTCCGGSRQAIWMRCVRHCGVDGSLSRLEKKKRSRAKGGAHSL